MPSIVAVQNSPVSMTSRDIAELVEKRHDNVKRVINDLYSKSIISTPQIEAVEDINNLGAAVKREVYVFDAAHKRDTFVVVAQLSPTFTAALVDRWSELESQRVAQPQQPALPLIPQEIAAKALSAELQVAHLLSAPLHLAQVEAVKAVERSTGIDFSHHLQHAPAQNLISYDEMMLEVTELGHELGIGGGAATNKWLASLGLQAKDGKVWKPTILGETMSTWHHWKNRGKSGYNLKWCVEKVRTYAATRKAISADE